VTAPLCDHAAGRQIPTADVAVNFYKSDMNILNPRVNGFGPEPVFIESEFHVLPFLTAAAYRLFGVRESLGRIVAIGFSAFSFFIFYGLASDRIGRGGAYYALFFFTFAPFSIYFSRVFMPEPAMLCFSLAALFAVSRWIGSDRPAYFLPAVLASALAFLSKIPTLYLLLPIGYEIFNRYGMSAMKRLKIWAYFILSILPAAAYAFYAYRMGKKSVSFGVWDPGYGAFNKWLDVRTVTDPGFYRAILERVATVGVTPLGIGLAVAGLIIFFRKKEIRFAYVWLLALLIYIFILARGNLANDYYQVPLVPVLCLFMGGPFVMLQGRALKIMHILLPVFAGLSLYWVFPLYGQDTWSHEAGRAAAGSSPAGTLVVANTPMTLYYAESAGWKVHYSSPEKIRAYISEGARRLVTTKTWPLRNNPDFLNYLTENFHLLKQTRAYLLFDLTRRGSPAVFGRVMKAWSLSHGGLVEAQMPVKKERPVFRLQVGKSGTTTGSQLLECLIDGRKAAEYRGPSEEGAVFTWRASTRIGMHRIGIRLAGPAENRAAPPEIIRLDMLKSK
jgi:hypothetical protein